MKAEIGVTDKNARTIAEVLNRLLADEHIVYTKTRNYHWNYEGDNFMEMHKFYEGQYEELAEMIDEIAERIRMIGHHAEGRLKDFLKLTSLEEQNYTIDQNEQVRNLTDDHQTIIRVLRNGIEKVDKLKDAGTVDLLADRFDIVARYQGGHNAGHSVYVQEKAFVLRLLPSGLLPRSILQPRSPHPLEPWNTHPGCCERRRRL